MSNTNGTMSPLQTLYNAWRAEVVEEERTGLAYTELRQVLKQHQARAETLRVASRTAATPEGVERLLAEAESAQAQADTLERQRKALFARRVILTTRVMESHQLYATMQDAARTAAQRLKLASRKAAAPSDTPDAAYWQALDVKDAASSRQALASFVGATTALAIEAGQEPPEWCCG